MDTRQHKQLTDLIDDLKANPLRRAEFLKEPIKTLAPLVGSSGAASSDLSLANQVLLATLRNAKLMDELRGHSVQHQSGEIDDTKLTQLTADSLSNHLPDEILQKVNHPGMKHGPAAGPLALANVVVHVDVAVIVTEIAVVHGTTFFNGMTDRSMLKLKDFANELAKGQ